MVRPKSIFYKIIPFSLFLFSIVLSCNRDSNELPEPKPETNKSVTRICKFYGKDILDVTFSMNNQDNTVNVSVKNVSNKSISKIKLLVELCSNDIQDFDNCGRQIVFESTDELKANGTWTTKGAEQSILYNKTIVNVYLISFENGEFKPKKDVLSGIYSLCVAEFKKTDGTRLGYGNAKGFILGDGNSVFRIKTWDEKFYNVSGMITTDEKYFGALLTSPDQNISLTSEPITPDKIIWSLSPNLGDVTKIDMKINKDK